MDKHARLVGTLAIAMAIVFATWIGSHAWAGVRKPRAKERTIQVTGSAKKRIVSDLIEWSASIETQNADRTVAYRALRDDVNQTLVYLKKQGVKDEEIRASSVTVTEMFDTVYEGVGIERVAKQVFRGYDTRQVISIRSSDVARVERVSREVSQLLESGVPIRSGDPEYYYTRLGELKIEMLAEASKDARTRADNVVKAAGGANLGKLRVADMGVINVNPANSTSTSWDGNNDTSSLEKDIITIVHMTYELR